MQTNKDGETPNTSKHQQKHHKLNIHSDQPPLLLSGLQLLFRRKARALTQRLGGWQPMVAWEGARESIDITTLEIMT